MASPKMLATLLVAFLSFPSIYAGPCKPKTSSLSELFSSTATSVTESAVSTTVGATTDSTTADAITVTTDLSSVATEGTTATTDLSLSTTLLSIVTTTTADLSTTTTTGTTTDATTTVDLSTTTTELSTTTDATTDTTLSSVATTTTQAAAACSTLSEFVAENPQRAYDSYFKIRFETCDDSYGGDYRLIGSITGPNQNFNPWRPIYTYGDNFDIDTDGHLSINGDHTVAQEPGTSNVGTIPNDDTSRSTWTRLFCQLITASNFQGTHMICAGDDGVSKFQICDIPQSGPVVLLSSTVSPGCKEARLIVSNF